MTYAEPDAEVPRIAAGPSAVPEPYETEEQAVFPQEGEQEGSALETLKGFLDYHNIAEDLDDGELSKIGDRVKREYQIDDDSRASWKERMGKSMDMALQVATSKNHPFRGAANIKFPLITTAAIQFAANAYPAIVPGKDVVKAKIVGSDAGVPLPPPPPQMPGMPPGPLQGPADMPGMPPMGAPMPPQGAPGPNMPGLDATVAQIGQQTPPQAPALGATQWQVEPGAKRKRADRVAAHMSYQLVEEMEEWEEDTDRMCHTLPIVGSAFRYTFYDRVLKRNRSKLILPMDCVVNQASESLERAPRISYEYELLPNEIEEKVRKGEFRDWEWGQAQGGGNDEDAPHKFIEQHRTLDLDDDGYKEPYIVTIHKDTGYVASIIVCFEEDDIEVNAETGDIVRIAPTRYFTKYGFIPDPEGGFYDIGFGLLMGPLNDSVNGIINRLLDAEHLQNAGGGFIRGDLRISGSSGGAVKFKIGEYKKVAAGAGNIRDSVLPIPFPGPSPTLFQLLGLLIDAAKDVSSVQDILTGDQPRNQPASTTLALIERGLKVFTAIYKRMHRSLKWELKKLYRLNLLYMDEARYRDILDDEQAISREDYRLNDADIVPVSDPTVVSSMQRMARAQLLLETKDDPRVDGKEILRRVFEAADIDDIELLVVDQGPSEADKLQVQEAGMRLAIFASQSEANLLETRSKTILNLAKAEGVEAGQQLDEYKARMDEMLTEVRAYGEQGKAQAAGGRGIPPMAGPPNNPQGPAIPTGR